MGILRTEKLQQAGRRSSRMFLFIWKGDPERLKQLLMNLVNKMRLSLPERDLAKRGFHVEAKTENAFVEFITMPDVNVGRR